MFFILTIIKSVSMYDGQFVVNQTNQDGYRSVQQNEY